MKILIIGYGKMGHMIEQCALQSGMEIGAAVDIDNISDLETLGRFDAALDFSSPNALDHVESYIKRTGTPYLCGCTGHTPEQKERVLALGKYAPVIMAANYSLGVAVVRKALEMMAPVLKDSFDIEILETHHNQKVDAPSGTAYLLLDAVDPKGEYERVYDRHDIRAPRSRNQIGLVSRRGGNMAGEHQVSFYGEDEVIEVTHRAVSRRIFAVGAIKVAPRLAAKENGVYTIDDLLF